MKGCGNLLIFVAILFLGVNSAKLPGYLKKCKKGPDSIKCVVENSLAAISTLGKDGEAKFKLQSLKPIHVPKIDLQATPQLKVVLDEVDFSGFENLAISEGHINDDELYLKGHMDRMELVGNYDINGRILILPIQGKGYCNITMDNFDFVYKAKLYPEERKGKKYLKVEPNESTFGSIDNVKRVYWQFDNLFNGDKRLGPEMNRFLNENWKEVFGEVKPAMEQTAAYSIFNYFINGYLHHIPINELFEE